MLLRAARPEANCYKKERIMTKAELPSPAGRRYLASERGFTLMELMVVIVILGILAAIVVPQFMSEPHKARVVQARLQMENFSTALKRYHLDNGSYPTTEQGLQALKEKPSIGRIPKNYPREGYMQKVPKDPWDNDYVYTSPGAHGPFDLMSYGADGEEGGQDDDKDIVSWEE